MPSFVKEIAYDYELIVRPICIAVTRQILSHSPISDCKVIFNGETEMALSNDSWVGSKSNRLTLDTGTTVLVTATEEYTEDAILTNGTNYNLNRPLFVDKHLGVELQPQYLKSTIAMNFNIQCKDKVTADLYRNRLARQMSLSLKNLLCEAKYDIPIDDVFFALMEELWKKQEANAGFGITLSDYILKHLSDALTVQSNFAGQESIFCMSESQGRISGTFDFLVSPEATVTDGTWSFSFGYSFQYRKPVSIYARYPLVIHNQLIDRKFVLNDVVSEDNGYVPYDDEYLMKFLAIRKECGFVSIPRVDNYKPKPVIPWCRPMLMVLTTNERRGNILENLNSIVKRGYKYHPAILRWMEHYHQRLTRRNNGFIHVALFEDQMIFNERALFVDSDLNLHVDCVLDPRKTYHIGIFLNRNMSLWPDDIKDEIKDNWLDNKDIFPVIDPDNVVVTNPDVGLCPDPDYEEIIDSVYKEWPKVRPDGSIPSVDMDKIIVDLSNKVINIDLVPKGGTLTVGIYGVGVSRTEKQK